MNGAARGKNKRDGVVYSIFSWRPLPSWILWFCSVVCRLPLTHTVLFMLYSHLYFSASSTHLKFCDLLELSHLTPLPDRFLSVWCQWDLVKSFQCSQGPTAAGGERSGCVKHRAACQWHIIMCNHSNVSRFGEITMNLSVDPFTLDWGGWVCREGRWTKLKWK